MGKRILWRKNPNTRYAFQIRAKNALGEMSAWSDPPARITTDPVPPLQPPTKVEAWALPLLNMIQVVWSNAKLEQGRRDITSYKVYRTTHDRSADVGVNDEIADVKGLFHIDYAKDFKGIATSGSTGSTLRFSPSTFKITMNGQRILNMGTIANPKTAYGTIVYVNSSTITASLAGGAVWAAGDRFIIDYVPLRNTQYYYWVRSISQEGRESALSACDGAKLGRPNDAVIDSFDEDESEDFLWLKGWRMTFHCPDGAEGYYVRWRRKDALIWSYPVYVPHNGEPDDPQTHVFKNKIVGKYYTFAVKAVNHLMYRQYQQEEYTTQDSYVRDAGNPQPPTQLRFFQGPWNNWIAWQQSSSQDVKEYQIWRKQRPQGGPDPTTPTGTELDDPYVKSWPAAASMFMDPIAGVFDRKNHWYWMRSKDWFGNVSALVGPVKEEDRSTFIQLTDDNIEQKLFGVKLSWNEIEGAVYYKIYRALTDDPTDARCIAPFWMGTTYIDLFAREDMRLLGLHNYYWVNAVLVSGQETLFAGTGAPGAPGVPDINTDTEGTLPEDRLELNYDTITLNSKINTKISSGDVNGIISNLTISPNAISMDSGYIVLRATSGYVALVEGADLRWTTGASGGWATRVAINVNNSIDYSILQITPTRDVTEFFACGAASNRWKQAKLFAELAEINATGNIVLSPASTSASQVRARLPMTANGSTKQLWSLYVDTDDGNTVKARWIST